MTEDEAKTKWCPQTLHATLRVTDHVKLPVEMSGALCIGSKCMAWRWLDDEPGCEAGFCGLAGRPNHA